MNSEDVYLFFDLYLNKHNYLELNAKEKLELIDITLNKYLNTQFLINKDNINLLNDAYQLCSPQEAHSYFENIFECLILTLEGIIGYSIEIEFDESKSLDDFELVKQDIYYLVVNPNMNLFYLTSLLLELKEEIVQNSLEVEQKIKQK